MSPSTPLEIWKRSFPKNDNPPARSVIAVGVIFFLLAFLTEWVLRVSGPRAAYDFLQGIILSPAPLDEPLEILAALGWVLFATAVSVRVKRLLYTWALIFPLFFGGFLNFFNVLGVCCAGDTNSVMDILMNSGFAVAAALAYALVFGTLGYILRLLMKSQNTNEGQ